MSNQIILRHFKYLRLKFLWIRGRSMPMPGFLEVEKWRDLPSSQATDRLPKTVTIRYARNAYSYRGHNSRYAQVKPFYFTWQSEALNSCQVQYNEPGPKHQKRKEPNEAEKHRNVNFHIATGNPPRSDQKY